MGAGRQPGRVPEQRRHGGERRRVGETHHNGRVLRKRGSTRPSVWSPDGRRIAYIDLGDVRIVDVDSGAVSIVASNASNPRWSPDGRSLAVVDQSITHADGLLNCEIAVLGADGGGRHIVLTLPASLAASSVAWSSAGTRLAVHLGPRPWLPPLP